MPFPVAAAIAAGAQVGSSLVGKHSNKQGLKAQTQATDAALENEKENEQYRRAEAKRIEDLQRAQFEAEQARLEPYRQAKAAFLRSQGVNLPDYARPNFVPGQTAQPASSGNARSLAQLAGMASYASPTTANIQPLSLQEVAQRMNWGG